MQPTLAPDSDSDAGDVADSDPEPCTNTDSPPPILDRNGSSDTEEIHQAPPDTGTNKAVPENLYANDYADDHPTGYSRDDDPRVKFERHRLYTRLALGTVGSVVAVGFGMWLVCNGNTNPEAPALRMIESISANKDVADAYPIKIAVWAYMLRPILSMLFVYILLGLSIKLVGAEKATPEQTAGKNNLSMVTQSIEKLTESVEKGTGIIERLQVSIKKILPGTKE